MRAHPLQIAALLLALAGLPSCASSGSGKDGESDEKFERRIAMPTEEETVGKLMTDLNGSLALWSNLTMTGDATRDERRTMALTHDLRYRTNKYKELLIEQLTFGPTPNRIVSAMALGFTEDPEVLGPLLAALEDSEERVESNALIGIAVLETGDTPTGCLTDRILDHPNEYVRGMAAYALLYVLRAGATGEGISEAALVGLGDASPIVRSQSLLVLAEIVHGDDIESIADLLYDDERFVRKAAMRALSWIGQQDDHVRGKSARALTAALAKSKSSRDKQALTANLMKLSSRNHGDDVAEWLNWANGLP